MRLLTGQRGVFAACVVAKRFAPSNRPYACRGSYLHPYSLHNALGEERDTTGGGGGILFCCREASL